MPTYEYKCDACGNAFEKFQSMSSAAIKKCPKCGKNKVRRLIGTGAGLIFKGSGFYITDYRDSKYQESKKADSGNSSGDPASRTTRSRNHQTLNDKKPAATESNSKTETKSESKPAAATTSSESKSAAPAKEKTSKSDQK